MNHNPARPFFLALSVLAFVFLLMPAAWLRARGRASSSLQPDPSAVFFTMVMQRGEPVSRGNLLILPSPATRSSNNSHGNGGSGGGGSKKGGGSSGGGGSTVPCCGGSLSLLTGSTPYSAGVVETPTTTQPEAEEEIAADPSDTTGDNLFAAISDFSSPSGYNNTKWALSTDGGTTWVKNFVPTNSSGALVTNDATWDANSDPVVAFDRTGNVFLSDLYLSLDSSGRITAEGLYVSTGQFGSIGSSNFPNTYPILTNLHNGKTFNIEDKPWITVDNGTSDTSHPGYVYASWSHFTGCQNQYSPTYGGYVLTCTSDSIYLSYSEDHGKTWLTTPIPISPSTQNGAVQGSQPAVGPDGTVYVTYEFFGSNNLRQQYLSVGKWNAGSLTFSAPFAVSPVFNELSFAGCSNCTVSYRVNSFPNIAVSPPVPGGNAAGNVYLVYGAQANSSSTAQVNFMACMGSCTSSSAFDGPANLDFGAAGEHFFPAIAVDPSGVVHTSWFDTRNNPSDPDLLDVYAAFLTYSSGSFTLSPNTRVTSQTINASYVSGFGDTSFIGDYTGIAASAATSAVAHPVWTNASGILGLPLAGSLQTSTLSLPPSVP